MLYLKRLDLFLQFLMPVIGVLIGWLTELWLGYYVGIAGIAFSQIMSAFFHLPVKSEKWYETSKRKRYIRLLSLLLSIEFIGLIAFFLLDQSNLFELAFAAFCMVSGTLLTIYYWNICFAEIRTIRNSMS
jgi:hypothetical protein